MRKNEDTGRIEVLVKYAMVTLPWLLPPTCLRKNLTSFLWVVICNRVVLGMPQNQIFTLVSVYASWAYGLTRVFTPRRGKRYLHFAVMMIDCYSHFLAMGSFSLACSCHFVSPFRLIVIETYPTLEVLSICHSTKLCYQTKAREGRVLVEELLAGEHVEEFERRGREEKGKERNGNKMNRGTDQDQIPMKGMLGRLSPANKVV